MRKLVGKVYREPGFYILELNHPLSGEKIRAQIEKNEFLKIIDDHWINRD